MIPKINGSGGAYLVFKKTNQMKINVLFGDVFIELQSASKQREHLAEGKVLSVVPSIIATTIPQKEMPLLHKRITTPMNFYLTRWKAVPVKAYLIFIIKSQFFSVSHFIMSLLVFVLRVETCPSPEFIQVQSLVKQSP